MDVIAKTKDARNRAVGLMAGLNTALTVGIVSALAAPDYGEWAGAVTTFTGLLTTLEAALKAIVVPIATVALIACFILMMISQTQKKVDAYRTWCITIFSCIIAIYAVPFIIRLATSLGSQF